MKRLLLLVLALMSDGISHAADNWTRLGKGGDTIFYVEQPSRVIRIGTFRRWWELQDFLVPGPIGDQSAKAFMEADCSQRAIDTIQLINYAGRMGEGKVLSTYVRNTSTTWSFVAPGSAGEARLEWACSK